MSEFLIRFDPPLPETLVVDVPLDLDSIDVVAVSSRYTQEHNILFSINGRVFAYYPSSVLTILNDLHLEWTLLRGRASHDVTLSGYTVLEAIFEKGGFQFRDPAWPPTVVSDIFDADYLEDKFRTATAAVWGLIRFVQGSP